MKVIDSSVLVMYFSREPGWREAEKALLDVVVTLDLAVKEVANALWKKIIRGEMGPEPAYRIVRDLASGAIPLYRQEPLLPQALRVAVEQRVTVYDALFIALAEELGAALVTADRRQAEAARARGVEAEVIG